MEYYMIKTTKLFTAVLLASVLIVLTNCSMLKMISDSNAYMAEQDKCENSGHIFLWKMTSEAYPAQSRQTCLKCGETTGSTRATALGDLGTGDGYIFYIAPNGFTVKGYGSPGTAGYFAAYTAHYLEAGPPEGYPHETYRRTRGDGAWTSFGVRKAWSYSDKRTGATGTELGTGRANTAAILATDPGAPAALTCRNNKSGGKSDWFFPSKGELEMMYTRRQHLEKDYANMHAVWSSTEVSDKNAFGLDFDGKYNFSNTPKKNELDLVVRSIRAF